MLWFKLSENAPACNCASLARARKSCGQPLAPVAGQFFPLDRLVALLKPGAVQASDVRPVPVTPRVQVAAGRGSLCADTRCAFVPGVLWRSPSRLSRVLSSRRQAAVYVHGPYRAVTSRLSGVFARFVRGGRSRLFKSPYYFEALLRDVAERCGNPIVSHRQLHFIEMFARRDCDKQSHSE